MKPAPKKNPATALRSAAEARLKKQGAAKARLKKQTAAGVRWSQHELEVHQIELEMQNQELLEAQAQTMLSLEQFADLYDFAPVGYFTLVADGTIHRLNLTGAQLLGMARGKLIGTRFDARVMAGDRKSFKDFLAKVFAGENISGGIQLTLTPKNGSSVIVQLEARHSAADGCRMVVIDVTAQVQAERQAAESLALNQSILKSLPGVMQIVDPAGRILYQNQAMKQVMGGLALGRKCWEADNRLQCEHCPLKQPLAIGDLKTLEVGGILGGRRFEINHVGIEYDGRPAVLELFHDITARELSAAALRESEARFRAYIDQAADAIFVHDFLGRFREVNSQACISLGYTREELLRMTVMDVETDFSLVQARAAWEQVAIGEKKMLSGHHRCKNGSIFPVEVNFGTFELEGERWFLGVARDISDRVRTEIELHQLKQSIAAAANGIFLVKPTGEIFWANDAFTRMTGYTAAEVIGKTPRLLKSGEHNSDFYRQMWQTVLNGNVWQGEIVNRRKDGVLYNENKTITPVKDASGQVSHFICVQEEITARKQAEAELIKARDFHLQQLQNAPALIWRAGVDGKCDWFNQTWLAFTGRAMAQEQGDGWAAGVHPDDLDDYVKRYLAHFEKREPFSMEYRLRRHDGEYRWIADHGQPMELPGDGFGGYIGYCYDIHEAKLARELLEQRVVERTREIALLSEVMDQSTVAFSMSNPDGSFIAVNEAYARLTGYTRAEIQKKKLNWSKELTPPEWRAISAQKLEECLRSRQTVRFEKEYLRKDGSRVPVEVFVQPIFDPEGKLLHLRAFIADITERKKAAEALQQAYQRVQVLSEVLNQSEIAFAIGYPDGSVGTFNQAYCNLLGYTQADFNNQAVKWSTVLTPPEWRPVVAEQLQKCIQTRQPVRFEKEYLRKDGRRVPVEVFAQPIFDSAGQLLELRTFVADITERKQNAKALEKAFRLAGEANRAKSEFLANMSHELRTPLNAVLGFTQLLRQDATLPEPVRDKLKIIHKSGENLLAILNDILDLAKIEAGRMTAWPVIFFCDEMLHEVVQLFRPPAEAKQLSLLLVKSEKIPHVVRADEEKIRRVLTNLIGNAVKFTQAGGVQVMASAASTGDAHQLRLRFEVKDTGPGIAPEELGHLFRKFEQTSTGQARHSGTGLGLAISQQYAWIMGGSITVQSQFGQGSTFVFEVPVELILDTDHIERRVKEITRRLAPDQPDCRVLVVDDMEDNRNFLLETLKQAGFDCRPAVSGAEALSVAAEWRPQLVLMDTRMPEMNGLETIRRLRAEPECSALKIISLSAMAYAEDREAAQTAGADDFVSKPVNIPELLEKIGRLLKISYIPVELDLVPAVPDSVPSRPETVAALACLPESWRNQLRDDLLVADFNRVEAAVMNIQPQHPALAEALRQLVNQFDAEGILNLLADAATRRT